jgi:hypothetical protein
VLNELHHALETRKHEVLISPWDFGTSVSSSGCFPRLGDLSTLHRLWRSSKLGVGPFQWLLGRVMHFPSLYFSTLENILENMHGISVITFRGKRHATASNKDAQSTRKTAPRYHASASKSVTTQRTSSS